VLGTAVWGKREKTESQSSNVQEKSQRTSLPQEGRLQKVEIEKSEIVIKFWRGRTEEIREKEIIFIGGPKAGTCDKKRYFPWGNKSD